METGPQPIRPGDVVRIRGERWRVVRHHPYRECAMLEVAGADAANRGLGARYLLPFDRVERTAASTGHVRILRPVALRHAMRRALAGAHPDWTSLRAAADARLSLLPFQLEPALAITQGRATRLLLADGVGLGKTIQAGLVVAEIRAREPDARVLIVAPAGLREQWRDELADRFDIHAALIDAAALARAAAQLPGDINPWSLPAAVITSIDFVKRPDVLRALEPLIWDVVVFDEAHGLAGHSDRSAAAGLIASRGRRVLLLTATPHSGDDESFARLCSLGELDGDRHPLVMFRRGREAAGWTLRRSTRLIAVGPTPAERRMYDALERYARTVRRCAPPHHAAGARLAMGILARRACSSPASLARSVERRLALLTGPVVSGGNQMLLPLDDSCEGADTEPVSELAAPGFADRNAERSALEELIGLARLAAGRESKVVALARLLRRCGEPAIVFTEYRDTLVHLVEALGVEDAAVLHGGLDGYARRKQTGRFTGGHARVLLATDAASEGLNLHQHCRLVINLEAPWTPTRFEQRAGRVDRLGQEQRPHVVTLAAKDTFEDRVVVRLARRLGRVRTVAPFTDAARELGEHIDRLDLKDEAAVEALRLSHVAAMKKRARDASPPARQSGPVAGILRRAGRHLRWALALDFLDNHEVPVWQSIIGIDAEGTFAWDTPTRDLATWLTVATLSASPALVRLSMEAHASHLRRLTESIRAATTALLDRDRAMGVSIRAARARLAVHLLEPNLFCRGTSHAAHAQGRLTDAALDALAGRTAAIEAARCIREGDRTLLFAVVTRAC